MTGTPRPLRPYTIPGPAGALEVLYRGAGTDPARGAALLCHPHPLHGGTMHSRVVHHLGRALGEAGLVTLRFNFRGVGASEGEYAGGSGEIDDTRAAFDHLGDLYGEPPRVIAGHSFGAWVGMLAGVAHPKRPALIGAGVPVGLHDFGFIADSDADVLVIQGDRDPFGSVEELRRAAAEWAPTAGLEVITGADHFFEGHLDELRRGVARFVERVMERPSG